MIEELRDDQIINKVGGRFKLSTLIQKRLVQLMAGARPLINLQTSNKLQIVVREILEDKIFLDAQMNVRTVDDRGPAGGPPELDLSQL